jgi:hypothetical protein
MSIPTVAIYSREHELLHEEPVIFGQGTDTKWIWENKHGFSFDSPSKPAYGLIKIDGVALFEVEFTLEGPFMPGDTVILSKGAIVAEEVRVD